MTLRHTGIAQVAARVLAPLALPLAALQAQGASPAGPPRFSWIEVVPGVYATVEPRELALSPLVHGNSMFVVGDSDVFVVDANRTPSAARGTIAQLRAVTDRPVRTLMLTHFHGDHLLGTQAFVEAFPGLSIVATDSTRDDVLRLLVAAFAKRPPGYYDRVADGYDSLYRAGVDMGGRPLTPARRAMFETVRAAFRNYYAAEAPTIRLYPPTTTIDGRMTLYAAGRRIDVLALGRANTRGDAIAWLPAERVVATGDVLVWPVPYTGGSYPSEWLRSLRRIRALGPLHVVPGHGDVQHDTRYLDLVIAVTDSAIRAVRRAAAAGLTLQQTHARVTMSRFRLAFTHGDPATEDRWSDFLSDLVDQAYAEAKGKL